VCSWSSSGFRYMRTNCELNGRESRRVLLLVVAGRTLMLKVVLFAPYEAFDFERIFSDGRPVFAFEAEKYAGRAAVS
jgi:hypothetical protein